MLQVIRKKRIVVQEEEASTQLEQKNSAQKRSAWFSATEVIAFITLHQVFTTSLYVIIWEIRIRIEEKWK